MTDIVLLDLDTADTDYIAKGKLNNIALRLSINALQVAIASSSVSVGPYLTALFGIQAAFIGSSSYAHSQSGTIMTLSEGYAWRPDIGKVVTSGIPVALNFIGQPAGTYYIQLDAAGIPSFTVTLTTPLWSVVWSGSAFGAITRMAPVFIVPLRQVASFTSVSDAPGATVNDYKPAGWNAATTTRALITAAAGGTTVTGFDATDVLDEDEKYIVNPSTTDLLKIAHLNSGSLAANQVSCPGGGEYDCVPLASFYLVRVGSLWTIR